MQRGSRQRYKLLRILRTSETPLTTAEIVEKMGKNPSNKTHCAAVRQLLQRTLGHSGVTRIAPGLYAYQAEVEKPRPTFEVSWGSDRRTPGALNLFEDILPKVAHLPHGEKGLDSNE